METLLQGIVIHTFRYNDKSVICKVFTEALGLKSFLVRTGLSPKRSLMPLLQPMNMVEFYAHIKEHRSLNSAKDFRLVYAYKRIPFDPVAGAIALFMDEVLYKTIHDDYRNSDLFHMVVRAMLALDSGEKLTHFPIWFLLELSREYGFYPQQDSANDTVFDAAEGCFVPRAHPCVAPFSTEASLALIQYLDKPFEELGSIKIPSSLRQQLLDDLTKYLQRHLENLRNIQSLAVLHEVFHAP
jgi:DNA repair protein RecO (recombination protein O)